MFRRRSRAFRRAPIIAVLVLLAASVAVLRVQAPPDLTAASAEAAAPVVRVVDGDTIIVRLAGREERVRYIGVNTPESVDPRRPVQAFGKEAAARNHELVEGKIVRLEKDVSDRDRFGRLLRYVYVGDIFVNARLVEEGYAQSASYPPDIKHQDLFRRLEREARAAKRGLWATP